MEQAGRDGLVLYQVEWCPYCHLVRQAMTELGLRYTIVNVTAEREARSELKQVSGQQAVPALLDAGEVFNGAEAIVKYLRERYLPAPDMGAHVERGMFRYVLERDVAPAQALAHLKSKLREHRFDVVSETTIAPQSEDGGAYVLLHLAIPVALALTLKADPSIPAALTVPVGVYPIAEGSQISITDPYAGAWLSCEPDLIRTAARVRDRVRRLFEDL